MDTTLPRCRNICTPGADSGLLPGGHPSLPHARLPPLGVRCNGYIMVRSPDLPGAASPAPNPPRYESCHQLGTMGHRSRNPPAAFPNYPCTPRRSDQTLLPPPATHPPSSPPNNPVARTPEISGAAIILLRRDSARGARAGSFFSQPKRDWKEEELGFSKFSTGSGLADFILLKI